VQQNRLDPECFFEQHSGLDALSAGFPPKVHDPILNSARRVCCVTHRNNNLRG
jgi:hypothetical protein